MAHALEFAALGLQAQAGCPVTFSRSALTLEAGVYQVVVEYTEEDVGRLAFDLAEQLCLAALNNTPLQLLLPAAGLTGFERLERIYPLITPVDHATDLLRGTGGGPL